MRLDVNRHAAKARRMRVRLALIGTCLAHLSGALSLAVVAATPQSGSPQAGLPGGVDSEKQMQALMQRLLLEKAPPPVESLPLPPADRRNLEGTWIGNQVSALRHRQDKDGRPLALTAEAQRILDRRVKATYVDHVPYANAAAYCRPPGAAWQLGLLYPFQVYQSGKAIIFIFSEYHTAWTIRLEQAHRDAGARDYMGDPVGHWDGETLVIDTARHKQPLWLDPDGSPGSADAHLTFRIRRTGAGGDGLEIVTTVDDPRMYASPWSFVRTYSWRPDMEFFNEYDCESQVGGPDALERFGLRPEPAAQ